jgi:hypothetical protein
MNGCMYYPNLDSVMNYINVFIEGVYYLLPSSKLEADCSNITKGRSSEVPASCFAK